MAPRDLLADDLADLLGPDPTSEPDPLDRSTVWSWCRSAADSAPTARTLSLRDVAAEITRTRTRATGDDNADKARLPMLSGARFGAGRKAEELVDVAAVFLDLDGEENGAESVPAEEAARRLRAAGVAGLTASSPSDGRRGKGARTRVILPLSRPVDVEEHARLASAAAWVVANPDWRDAAPEDRQRHALLHPNHPAPPAHAAAAESWDAWRFYFIGGFSDAPAPRVELAEGRYLDQAEGLGSIAAPRRSARIGGAAQARGDGDFAAQAAATSEAQELAGDLASGKLRAALDAILADPEAATPERDAYPADWRTILFGLARAAWFADDATAADAEAEWTRWAQGSARARRKGWGRIAAASAARRGWHGQRDREPAGGDVTLASVYDLADGSGADWRPKDAAAQAALDEAKLEACLGDLGVTPAPREKPGLEWLHESVLPEARSYLVRGLLDQGATSALYGRSNAGKTFVAMDLAFHVATGRPWCDRPVARASVLYLALEGGDGFTRRVLGLRQANRVTGPIPFAYRRGGARLCGRDAAEDVAEIVGMAGEVKAAFPDLPQLIVVDTLNRALAGGDENSSADMGAFVRAIDRIRAMTGAHVLVVHHTGKDEAKGMRGHSSFLGAIDTELAVTRREGERFGDVVLHKSRDSEDGIAIGRFRQEPVAIGRDPEGGEISTLVLRWVAQVDPFAEPEGVAGLASRGRATWNALRRLGGAAGREELIGALAGESSAASLKDRRDYATRGIAELRTAGLIRETGDRIEAAGFEDIAQSAFDEYD